MWRFGLLRDSAVSLTCGSRHRLTVDLDGPIGIGSSFVNLPQHECSGFGERRSLGIRAGGAPRDAPLLLRRALSGSDPSTASHRGFHGEHADPACEQYLGCVGVGVLGRARSAVHRNSDCVMRDAGSTAPHRRHVCDEYAGQHLQYAAPLWDDLVLEHHARSIDHPASRIERLREDFGGRSYPAPRPSPLRTAGHALHLRGLSMITTPWLWRSGTRATCSVCSRWRRARFVECERPSRGPSLVLASLLLAGHRPLGAGEALLDLRSVARVGHEHVRWSRQAESRRRGRSPPAGFVLGTGIGDLDLLTHGGEPVSRVEHQRALLRSASQGPVHDRSAPAPASGTPRTRVGLLPPPGTTAGRHTVLGHGPCA
jgi:hypothetical protein